MLQHLPKTKSKFYIDKWDVDKLKSIPDDFKKFDNVVDIDVVKKVLHNKFVSKLA